MSISSVLKALKEGRSFQSKSPLLDKLTYKPYKGYNRLHSKKWNLERLGLVDQKLSKKFIGYQRQKDALKKVGIDLE